MSAIYTNAATDFLLSVFIFSLFLKGLIQFNKKDSLFSLLILCAFFTMFVLTSLGSYAHYFGSHLPVEEVWIAISMLTILLNYSFVQAIEMPDICRLIAVFLSIVFSYIFIIRHGNYFDYIAIPMIMVYLIAAFYSKSMLRWGFLLVVCSNILWIIARNVESLLLGHSVPPQYTYDNDVYHFLVMFSVFVVYKSIVRGYWPYPRGFTQ